MKRRSFFLYFAIVAGLAAPPSPTFAQNSAEPVYVVTLPDKQIITLTTVFNDDGNGAKSARVVTLPDGYGKSDLSLFASVSVNPEGYPVAAAVQFGPKSVPKALKLQGKRIGDEAGGDKDTVWAVNVPASTETISYSGIPLTLPTAHGALGRQYNFARGGEQPFLCLLDFAVLTPTFYPITLRYDGTETIALEGGAVKARRLKYVTALPYLPKEQNEGVIYVGTRGEVLRCDTNLFATPFKALGSSKSTGKAGEWELKMDRPGDVFVRERLLKDGIREISIEAGPGNYPVARGTVNKAGRPLTLSSPWLGRALTVTFTPTTAIWSLAATEPVKTAVASGKAWFVPNWFVTESWETGAGPWANMAIGDKRDGSYFPLFTGQQEGGTFTMERKPDYTAQIGGSEVVLRRYNVQTKVTYDLLTDGKRMVYFVGSDGLKSTRTGFESLGNTIPAPKAPEVAVPKPTL
ncbi:MAG: hypothetical protein H8F28_17290 [Fibrella sp.]|nr:hypothetical protein [Armatimonadota bacterium]